MYLYKIMFLLNFIGINLGFNSLWFLYTAQIKAHRNRKFRVGNANYVSLWFQDFPDNVRGGIINRKIHRRPSRSTLLDWGDGLLY